MAHYFITGASSGIGAALAEALLARGETVTAIARREDRLKSLKTGRGTLHTAACDVTDATALAATIDAARSKHGQIDAPSECRHV